MKRILSLVLMGVILITSVITFASCGKPKFEFELNEDGASYKLIGMENAIGDIVVPGTYNDLPVTKIAEDAIKDKPRMTSIVLPDSILEIEKYAFSGNLNGLKSITIGKNVTYIGDYAIVSSSMLEFKEINYRGTAEQWKALCRYELVKSKDQYTEVTKVYHDDKVVVNCNYEG